MILTGFQLFRQFGMHIWILKSQRSRGLFCTHSSDFPISSVRTVHPFLVYREVWYKSCGLCAVVVQLLAACRVSISLCAIHDNGFLYNTHHEKAHFQAAAINRGWLVCRHAVAMVQLLFQRGYYTRLYSAC